MSLRRKTYGGSGYLRPNPDPVIARDKLREMGEDIANVQRDAVSLGLPELAEMCGRALAEIGRLAVVNSTVTEEWSDQREVEVKSPGAHAAYR